MKNFGKSECNSILGSVENSRFLAVRYVRVETFCCDISPIFQSQVSRLARFEQVIVLIEAHVRLFWHFKPMESRLDRNDIFRLGLSGNSNVKRTPCNKLRFFSQLARSRQPINANVNYYVCHSRTDSFIHVSIKQSTVIVNTIELVPWLDHILLVTRRLQFFWLFSHEIADFQFSCDYHLIFQLKTTSKSPALRKLFVSKAICHYQSFRSRDQINFMHM